SNIESTAAMLPIFMIHPVSNPSSSKGASSPHFLISASNGSTCRGRCGGSGVPGGDGNGGGTYAARIVRMRQPV
ncbi:hypothetical protein L9F63_001606, partial [Diploptera punctata]